ncbi:MAG TPA: hypothetical protein VE776_14670 [Actinomycetota bacterium]|jgi:hypothetical protein|nr:hypothetical protein [Actinomycetota bacterium]
METGIFIGWGKPVAGHGREALTLFSDLVEFFTKKREAGVITSFEPFFYRTADFGQEAGFFVIRGPAEGIETLNRDEEYIVLLSKAIMLVEHIKTAFLWSGEGVTQHIDRLGKLYAELAA